MGCICEGTDLYLLRPTLGPHKNFQHMTRAEEVVITRLRIGHSKATNSYILSREPPTTFQCCGQTMEDTLLKCAVIQLSCNAYYTADSLKTFFETYFPPPQPQPLNPTPTPTPLPTSQCHRPRWFIHRAKQLREYPTYVGRQISLERRLSSLSKWNPTNPRTHAKICFNIQCGAVTTRPMFSQIFTKDTS